MNNLSWLLYIAEVVPRLGVIGFVGILIGLLLGSFLSPKGVDQFGDDHYPFTGFLRYDVWVVIVISSVISIATPSKETIYLIAGSEAGEYVVQSPEGQEILEDIHAVIKHQLNQLAGEE